MPLLAAKIQFAAAMWRFMAVTPVAFMSQTG